MKKKFLGFDVQTHWSGRDTHKNPKNINHTTTLTLWMWVHPIFEFLSILCF
jgi:hypothetical protein